MLTRKALIKKLEKTKLKLKEARIKAKEEEKKLNKQDAISDKADNKVYKLDDTIDDLHDHINDYEEYKRQEIMKLPKRGAFICYKKIYTQSGYSAIATLEVPKKAKRITPSSIYDGKSRVSEAKVLKITSNGKVLKHGWSRHDCNFKYTVGKTVVPNYFDTNKTYVCTGGIHVYKTIEQAINH